ncbi:hypothetical protein CU097_003178, partial [Rhizopus azygosporus]
MTRQSSANLDSEDLSIYKVGGIMNLHAFNKVKILLLLETSEHFGNKENSKTSFGHHKGLFGALSMLKTIASEHSFGSMVTFKKLKVHFIHAAGTNVLELLSLFTYFLTICDVDRTVRLWSIKYIPEGPLFEPWLEQSLRIKPYFDNRLEQVPDSMRFYWAINCLIEETIKDLSILKKSMKRLQ